MKKYFLLIVCFLFANSCKSQKEENPKYLGKGQGFFYLDKIDFKENKDTLFSKVDVYFDKEENRYTIKESKKLNLKIGSEKINIDGLQWVVNPKSNQFVMTEFLFQNDTSSCKKIIQDLRGIFNTVDLTDKKYNQRSNFAKNYTYLFKDENKYILLDHSVYVDDKQNDLLWFHIYKYPFDKNLLEQNKVDKRILNQ